MRVAFAEVDRASSGLRQPAGRSGACDPLEKAGGPVRRPVARSARGRATAMLRSAGARVTPIRVSVIELLLGQSCALSAADVLSGLRAEAPDRVTIYRTLSALTECGLIHQQMNFDKVRRYLLGNTGGQSWIKFRCVVCGAERTRRAELPAAGAFPGCEITGQTLMVEGRCEDCRVA